MKKTLLFLAIALLVCTSTFAQITIADARNQPLASDVTFKGVVTNGAELGVIRYIQDETGGTAIYSSNFASSMNRGDSILVTGTIADFNNLMEINPVATLTVLNSGNPLPTPQIVTPIQLDETLEGELIQIENVTFTNAGSVFTGNASFTFSSANETSTIFVRNGSPLIGQVIPVGSVTMVGICSQFFANYQVLPRDMNDFITGPGINITSLVPTSSINTLGFSLSWTTDIDGTSEVMYGLTPQLEMGILSNMTPTTNHTYPLFGLDAGKIYYCQAFSVASGDTAFSAIRPYGTASLSSGNVTVYFNSSVDTTVSSGNNATLLYHAIDDTLISYINRAEQSLDMTIYDFSNDSISNISEAINAAKLRGVKVRFISDGSLAPTNYGVPELDASVPRIESPTSSEYNIMHNKFVIIDANHEDPLKPIVWTGSTNWTKRQLYKDNNSVIIVQDQTLARAYTLEFEEMWGSTDTIPDITNSRFGPFKLDNTPHEFKVGGKRMECYFSPSDGTNNYLIKSMNTAQTNIHFATMLITRADIADTLVSSHAQGLIVNGIIDDQTSTTQYNTLFSELGTQDLVINSDTSIIMHHKYLIVDEGVTSSDPLLWVGSHNWSNNANTKNDENTLVVHDIDIVNQYYQEFMARFQNWPTLDPFAVDTTSTDTTDTTTTINIRNLRLFQTLSVYPNPTKINAPVYILNSESGNCILRIYNSDLKCLSEEKIFVNGNLPLEIPFRFNHPGCYFVSISFENKIQNARIIVTD